MAKFEPIDLSGGSSGNSVSASEPYPAEGVRLFLSNPRVVDLPECGTITFRFERGPVTIVEALRGNPGRASVDLSLLEIVSVKAEEAKENEKPDAELDRLFEQATESEEAE